MTAAHGVRGHSHRADRQRAERREAPTYAVVGRARINLAVHHTRTVNGNVSLHAPDRQMVAGSSNIECELP